MAGATFQERCSDRWLRDSSFVCRPEASVAACRPEASVAAVPVTHIRNCLWLCVQAVQQPNQTPAQANAQAFAQQQQQLQQQQQQQLELQLKYQSQVPSSFGAIGGGGGGGLGGQGIGQSATPRGLNPGAAGFSGTAAGFNAQLGAQRGGGLPPQHHGMGQLQGAGQGFGGGMHGLRQGSPSLQVRLLRCQNAALLCLLLLESALTRILLCTLNYMYFYTPWLYAAICS